MPAINIAVDMPARPTFDVERFRQRVQDYANRLCIAMSDNRQKEQKLAKDRQEALAFIQSLAVPGGENVPNDINPMECFVADKYGE